MHLTNRRPLVLGMLLISALGLSTSIKASATGTAQPFTCGTGIQATIDTPPVIDRRITVGKMGKVIQVISFGGNESTGGMDVQNLRKPNDFRGLSVYIKEGLGRTRAQVNTQLCFSDSNGTFTVTRQLKDYQFEIAKDGWNRASVYAIELPPRATGATLTRYTCTFTSGPKVGVMSFGDVVLSGDDVGQLLTTDEGCAGGAACQ